MLAYRGDVRFMWCGFAHGCSRGQKVELSVSDTLPILRQHVTRWRGRLSGRGERRKCFEQDVSGTSARGKAIEQAHHRSEPCNGGRDDGHVEVREPEVRAMNLLP